MGMTLHGSIMAGTAFFVAAGLIPVLRGPARRFGLVDNPCRRKRHNGAVPLTGGLAMFLAFAVTMLFNLGYIGSYWTLLAGMAVLLVIGLLDDLMDIRALYKLIAQVTVASLMVYAGGLEIAHLGNLFGAGKVGLGPFSTPFTIACVVLLINAINMTDGLDGLAGGIGMVILLMLAMIGWLGGAPASLITICLVLAMAVLGFLIYNMQSPFRKNASAFMGDAGSMMLGFGVAWLAIAIVKSPGSSVYPITIAWLLLIPCMDILAVTFRRMSQGRSPMSADRSHLHHIIQRCGFSTRATVRLVHLMVAGTGTVGILAWQFALPQWLLFVMASAAIVGYMVLLTIAHRIMRWRLRRRRAELAGSEA
jgi:UDP-GlcNAc:undecaprenyl-phosphate GlcNAc-1-phosphate transferase